MRPRIINVDGFTIETCCERFKWLYRAQQICNLSRRPVPIKNGVGRFLFSKIGTFRDILGLAVESSLRHGIDGFCQKRSRCMVLSLQQLPSILGLSDHQFSLGDNSPCINFLRHHMHGNPCN